MEKVPGWSSALVMSWQVGHGHGSVPTQTTLSPSTRYWSDGTTTPSKRTSSTRPTGPGSAISHRALHEQSLVQPHEFTHTPPSMCGQNPAAPHAPPLPRQGGP